MAQDWDVPPAWQQAQPLTPAPLDAAQMNAAHELRPLSTGEILDRTFSIYRSRFSLFAGMASLAAAAGLLMSLLQLLVHHLLLVSHGLNVAAAGSQITALVGIFVRLPVTAVVYAASVFALCEIYLGRDIDAKAALKTTVGGRWIRYVGISLWWGWSAAWLGLLLFVPAFVLARLGTSSGNTGLTVMGGLLVLVAIPAGFVYGVIAYIRNSLAIPASLMEQTGVRASMRRSKTLAKGTKGRIFVVLLIAGVLYLVAGAIEFPMLIVIGKTPLAEHFLAQAAILAIGFIAETLVSPIALIGLTLVYFDQRVRHEAFDLLMMLGPEATPAESQPLAWPPAPAAEATSWPPAPPPQALVLEPVVVEPVLIEPPAEPPTPADDEKPI
jgi:hypothetical protein